MSNSLGPHRQSREFSRPEYWNEYPIPSPADLPDPGIEPVSPALQADSLPAELPGNPEAAVYLQINTMDHQITERPVSMEPYLCSGWDQIHCLDKYICALACAKWSQFSKSM